MTVLRKGGNDTIRNTLFGSLLMVIIASTLEASDGVGDRKQCRSIKYWDVGTSSCEHCFIRCQPGGGLQRECRELCLGTQKR